MTPQQLQQWHDYACVARCLLKIATINGHPMTRDEFCSKFEHLFPDTGKRYGQLDAQGFFAVLKPLSLPANVTQSDDYATVESAFDARSPVLLLSHVDLNPGMTSEINHCSVITRMGATGFSIWTPCQNGVDESLDLTNADWTSKQCSGLIFA